MFFLHQFQTLLVFQVELHAAHLGADTTVGTASEGHFTDVAASAEAHTQGSMYKHFQTYLGTCLVDGTNFVNRQFAGQHHLFIAVFPEPPHFFGSAVVHLGGGVEVK